MTPQVQPVRQDDVDRAVHSVREQANAGALGALAYDLLALQAEGRTLLAGREMVQARAQEHAVEREAAASEAGNLLTILERGAESPLERALVAAFAVRGLGDKLEGESEQDAARRIFRFVRHGDWLEVSSPYVVYAFVDPLLTDASASRVYEELAQAVVDDAAGRDGGRAEVRARNAARLSAMAASSSTAARDALRRVTRSVALDEPTRLFASTLAGDGEEKPTLSPRLEGRIGRVPRAGALLVLRWISGVELAMWAVRGIAFVVGWRRKAELRLERGGLDIKTQVSLLGRPVRETTETWKLEAVSIVRREARYPAIHLIVGAVALSAGVLIGGLFLFDGARSGELVLLLLAAALVLAGAALDLALDVLVPGIRGRVAVELWGGPRKALRLTSVRLEEADAFLRALRSRDAH